MQSCGIMDKCQICEDYALIVNYGVLSCLPCRTFFRRNALHPQKLRPCRYNGRCEMNLLTRKSCSSCRLNRCFAVGMRTELIRREMRNGGKRKFNSCKDVETVLARIPEESALDRPAGGSYILLSQLDKVLISNVVHAFDAFNPKPQIENAIKCAKDSPSNIQYNLWQMIQLLFSCLNGLQSFISATPDFRILTSAEQCSLLRRNILGVIACGAISIVKESGIFDKPGNELIFSLVYGTKVTQRARSVLQQIDFDPIVFKLVLISLTFSSNCYMLDYQENINEDSLLLGTFRLFGSQNVYVELLWKFLLVKYGFDRSVKIFSKVITQLFSVFSISMDTYKDNKIHEMVLDDAIKRTKTSSIVDKTTAKVPLWGKAQY